MGLLELEDGWDLEDDSAAAEAQEGSAADAASFVSESVGEHEQAPATAPEVELPAPEPVAAEPELELPPPQPPAGAKPVVNIPAPGPFTQATTELGPFGVVAAAAQAARRRAAATEESEPAAELKVERDAFARPAEDFVPTQAVVTQSQPLPFGDPADASGSADSVELHPNELPLPPVDAGDAMGQSPFGVSSEPEIGTWTGPAEDSDEVEVPIDFADAGPEPELRGEPAGTELSIGGHGGGVEIDVDLGATAAPTGVVAGADIDIDVDFGAAAEPGSAMDLVESAQRSGEDTDGLLRRARELHELGDFSGSLAVVEKVLAVDPGNAEASSYLQRNEGTLLSMYESKLGALSNVPVVAISEEEVMWLNLNHRAGFVLSQIDGMLTYEEILDLSAMPRLETCRIFVDLIREGVIRNRAG